MTAAHKLATACDIFYTRGRSVAWFNGVLHLLGLKPAEFLQRFATWLERQQGGSVNEADLSDYQIWQMQRSFLSRQLNTRKLKRFLLVVLDLVDYHYHYAAALMTPPPRTPSKKALARTRLLEAPLSLSPSTRLATFHYDILEILEAGVPDVRGFADNLDSCGSWAVIYPTTRGVCTESLDPSLYCFLEQLDGHTAPSVIMKRNGVPADMAAEFLSFALSEGIVLPAKEATPRTKT
jgi:hypothetical protein